ncbi:lipoyl(octanoyl) transferase [Leucobacter luti]|uniref:Octanoyltransferase n=1 Tax=Leucobacter luti TaxID=340320 RepID=A0A4R6S6Y0_9MICO|nr:lipoyl(octanoyl) transferase LipB [Leucobacter luti]TDP94555.1 lipoyl(octanoyl) transferase [Leucobacter luti]
MSSPHLLMAASPAQRPRVASPRFDIAGLAPQFVDYEHGLSLQREAADRVRSGADRGTVFLLEHPPVYTAGRRSLPEEYPTDGTPVVAVNRGGKVTWHGPGQLVVYPVIRLADRVGVVDFVRALEGVLIDVAAQFGVSGFRVPGRSGVWAAAQDNSAPSAPPAPPAHPVASDQSDAPHPGAAQNSAHAQNPAHGRDNAHAEGPGHTQRPAHAQSPAHPPQSASDSRHLPHAPAKFAQIGLHTADGIVTHGIALNCSNDLTPFDSFVPCGISDAGVTSLSALAGRTISPAEAAPILQARLATALLEVVA